MKTRLFLVVGLALIAAVLAVLGGCSKEDPKGACCLPNHQCVTDTEKNCQARNGGYHGDNVACTPELCPQDSWISKQFTGTAISMTVFTLMFFAGFSFCGWRWYKATKKVTSITNGAAPAALLVLAMCLGLGGCGNNDTSPTVAIEKVNREYFIANGKHDTFVADKRPTGWATPFVFVGRLFSNASSYAWYSGCSETTLDPSNGSMRTFYNGEFQAHGIAIHTSTLNCDGKDIVMSFANVDVYKPSPNDYEKDEMIHFKNLAVIHSRLDAGIYTIEVYSPSGDRRMHFRGASMDGHTEIGSGCTEECPKNNRS